MNYGLIQVRKIPSSYKLSSFFYLSLAETTKKIPMTHIRNIVDEPIEGNESYAIVGFQTGTT